MTPMTNDALLTKAAHDLIYPWTEVITRDSGKWEATDPLDPLLTTLDELVASNGGGSTGGASQDFSRNLVNMRAFRLRERIRKQAHEWHPATGVKIGSKLPLRASIQHMVTRAELLYSGAQMTEQHYTGIIADCKQWKRDIQDAIDPPRIKEIAAACPRCEVAFVLTPPEEDEDGETGEEIREPALTVRYKAGDKHPAQARCAYCNARWTGEQELMQLAGIIGANSDYDTLKEMGMSE